jgi:ribosome-binding factor A
MSQARANRVADRIKELVAVLLESRVKDPRLGFITVTDVRVTGDLREASVFYTVLGDEAQQKSTKAALDSATGMLNPSPAKILIKKNESIRRLCNRRQTHRYHFSRCG